MLDIGTAKFDPCVFFYFELNISGIRNRAIEIVNVFEMEVRWFKNMIMINRNKL